MPTTMTMWSDTWNVSYIELRIWNQVNCDDHGLLYNDNARKQSCDWLNEKKNNHVAQEQAHKYIFSSTVVCNGNTESPNFRFYQNMNTHQSILCSPYWYLLQWHSNQSSCSILCQQYRIQAWMNNHKIASHICTNVCIPVKVLLL